MSTFKGILTEFPHIRIDYFRPHPAHSPPLACFLSHIHSDHLVGLESYRAPFIYCSVATRELLLKLEKYPQRMNFTRGILEARVVTYTHLKHLLKPIPLDTPTVIELAPGNRVRVTLLDANHCVGAVMFLIEGDGKAVLYTGDVRSEQWWVDRLVRNPVVLPYTSGYKTLDCVYLDTTFATTQDLYCEFPSKREGIAELLGKVQKYPRETRIYVQSWTFGYEDVWVALSAFLDDKIHLDSYRWRLYSSLGGKTIECEDAAKLVGFQLGNHQHRGCLTQDSQVRIHSCEHGGGCPVMDKANKAVRIIPIVTRAKDGTEVYEPGAGGGLGDLDQEPELEMQDLEAVEMLIALCKKTISDEPVLQRVSDMIKSSHKSLRGLLLSSLSVAGAIETDDTTIADFERLINKLIKMAKSERFSIAQRRLETSRILPQTITFPYSRHSSYSELCELVKAFKPKDVYPCTVDEENWSHALSVKTLFGRLCSEDSFRHDREMVALGKGDRNDTQSTSDSRMTGNSQADTHYTDMIDPSEPVNPAEPVEGVAKDVNSSPVRSDPINPVHQDVEPAPALSTEKHQESQKSDLSVQEVPASSYEQARKTRKENATLHPESKSTAKFEMAAVVRSEQSSTGAQGSKRSAPVYPLQQRKRREKNISRWAYYAAAGLDEECDSWEAFGGLTCTKNASQELPFEEEEDGDDFDDEL